MYLGEKSGLQKGKSSIRLKITVWFSLILLFISFFTFFSVFYIYRNVMQKTVKDSLIQMMEDNFDEVEYKKNGDSIDEDSDDRYLEYSGGYIEIDDDFIEKMNGINAGIYDSNAGLIFGSCPNVQQLSQVSFKDGKVQSFKDDGIIWYVYDKSLASQDLEGLWLRGAVSEEQGQAQISDTLRLSLYLLPILLLIAILGGYIFAGRLLSPINEINTAAMDIGRGRDLSKRIDLGPGNDELHQLADNFNDMISRLEESFSAEQQFTSDVSHELRTPLSVIKAECEYILEEDREREEYIEALETIERQESQMSRMVEDLLMFSRLERRTEIYTKEILDFSELVRSVCEDMALLKTRDICLECSCEDHVRVNGNRGLLVRMLGNLISNAYRYGNPGGYIRVRLTSDSDGPLLEVEDNGIGISQENQDKIFHRFYQVDSSRTGAGTGLGLAIVEEIVRFHDAEIRLTSEPGQGSTFSIRFMAV